MPTTCTSRASKTATACRCALLLAAVWLAGCTRDLLPVEGVVFVDGNPAESGTGLLFCPLDNPGRPATGRVGADGRFTMQTGPREGVMRGRFKVAISNSTNSVEPPVFVGDPDPYSPEFQLYDQRLREFLARPAQPGMIPVAYSSMTSTPLEWRVPEDGREARFDISSGATGK
jgi:hypothetical protein